MAKVPQKFSKSTEPLDFFLFFFLPIGLGKNKKESKTFPKFLLNYSPLDHCFTFTLDLTINTILFLCVISSYSSFMTTIFSVISDLAHLPSCLLFVKIQFLILFLFQFLNKFMNLNMTLCGCLFHSQICLLKYRKK